VQVGLLKNVKKIEKQLQMDGIVISVSMHNGLSIELINNSLGWATWAKT